MSITFTVTAESPEELISHVSKSLGVQVGPVETAPPEIPPAVTTDPIKKYDDDELLAEIRARMAKHGMQVRVVKATQSAKNGADNAEAPETAPETPAKEKASGPAEKPAEAPPEEKPKPATKKAAPKKAASKKVKIKTIQGDEFMGYIKKLGVPDVREILEKHGGGKLADIAEDKHEAVRADLEAAVEALPAPEATA